MDFLRKFAERVSPGKELHIIGPAWASVGKVNDVYRKVLYLKHSQESVLLDIKINLKIHRDQFRFSEITYTV